MKYNMKIFLSVILTVLIYSQCFSQEIDIQSDTSKRKFNYNLKKSNDIRAVNGRYVYFHIVKSKQTMYSISKLYNVSIKEIVQFNNLHSEEINVGQTLLIPVKDNLITDIQEQEPKVVKGHDTTNYYYITVKPKETLYNISRTYNVSIKDIQKANDGLKDGLKINSVIRIPKNDSNLNKHHQNSSSDNKINHQVSSNNNTKEADKVEGSNYTTENVTVNDTTIRFISHRVRLRQTLESIADKYSVSIDDIIKYNPFAAKGIKWRQVLRVPVYTVTEKIVTIEKPVIQVNADSIINDAINENALNEYEQMKLYDANKLPVFKEDKRFKVAILIPIYLKMEPDIQINYNDGSVISGNIKPFRFLSFYQGALIAIDSLTSQGMNIDLYVYDVDNTINSARRLIVTDVLKDMDLIVGPFYKSPFQVICNYAEMYDIPIVNPTTESLMTGCGYYKSFKMNVDKLAVINRIVKYGNIKFGYPDFIAFTPEGMSVTDQKNEKHLNSLFNDTLSTSRYRTFSNFYLKDNNYTNILSSYKDNIVISFAGNLPEVVNLTSKLYKSSSKYKIHLFGNKDWLSNDLDFTYLDILDLHICETDFILYESDKVKSFTRNFNMKNASYPDQFAFLGFDTFYYFLKMLHNFGTDFHQFTPYVYYNGLSNSVLYKYNKNGVYGYNNIGVRFYKLVNNKFIEVPISDYYNNLNIIDIDSF